MAIFEPRVVQEYGGHRPNTGDFSVLISKAEVLAKYNISESWLMRKMKEEGIRPRIIKGKAHYPKKDVDRMFKPSCCCSCTTALVEVYSWLLAYRSDCQVQIHRFKTMNQNMIFIIKCCYIVE